ncbi:GNAT family protein [Cupriavidus basilensis]|uniref:GNAT family protein n=1 Tax=Cupriavidus basilensis TaxID=68895 RepID=A0ABT6AJU1_9BURK|nr:GNAT family protein [Cupriavidus basilensis]MDF3832046.1 GNAT family protein [Cupriavidus basilensis]
MRIDLPPASGYPGIVLRQLEREDMDPWFAYLTLPDVIRHTSWNLRSPQDLLPILQSLEDGSASSVRRLAMIDEQSKALVGTIGFHTVSEINRSAEIAYDLAPGYWGRGIASAVCAAVAGWSYTEYGFVRVQAVVLTSNARSESVLKKCGFRYEGLLRSYRMVRGTPGDFKMFARLQSD